jgi:hypothetical protein
MVFRSPRASARRMEKVGVAGSTFDPVDATNELSLHYV